MLKRRSLETVPERVSFSSHSGAAKATAGSSRPSASSAWGRRIEAPLLAPLQLAHGEQIVLEVLVHLEVFDLQLGAVAGARIRDHHLLEPQRAEEVGRV